MSDNAIIPEIHHCMEQNISCNALNDVLHELRSVAFDTFPLFLLTNTHVSDRFAAELVFADFRFHIGKSSAGWKLDEQKS